MCAQGVLPRETRRNMAASIDDECELSSSKLGTKEYWDGVYERELDNFQETKDVGEVWFGIDSVERVTDWMEDCPFIEKSHSILDLGCGNGILLVELAKRGFTNLSGVDYSHGAIDLAQAVSNGEELKIEYQVGDILAEIPSSGSILSRPFDICLDKGTYDAISLNPKSPKAQRASYCQSLKKITKPGGLFIITSCNWTEEEVTEHFSEGFSFLEKIPSPTFQFGGRSGSRESVLVFQRRR